MRVVFGPVETDLARRLRAFLRTTDQLDERPTAVEPAGGRRAGSIRGQQRLPGDDGARRGRGAGEVQRRQQDPDCTDETDIAAMLGEARYEDGSPMTEQDLRDELVTLLTDGPTSSLLSWAFERILRHPEQYARLRDEVDGRTTRHLSRCGRKGDDETVPRRADRGAQAARANGAGRIHHSRWDDRGPVRAPRAPASRHLSRAASLQTRTVPGATRRDVHVDSIRRRCTALPRRQLRATTNEASDRHRQRSRLAPSRAALRATPQECNRVRATPARPGNRDDGSPTGGRAHRWAWRQPPSADRGFGPHQGLSRQFAVEQSADLPNAVFSEEAERASGEAFEGQDRIAFLAAEPHAAHLQVGRVDHDLAVVLSEHLRQYFSTRLARQVGRPGPASRGLPVAIWRCSRSASRSLLHRPGRRPRGSSA